MPLDVDHLATEISALGIATAEQVHLVIDALPEGGDAVKSAVDALVDRGVLSRFQAEVIVQGRSKALQIGEYTVIDRIGQGGMGQVYKAQHRRMKRLVALKVLNRAAVQSEAMVRRFYREVEAAAKLTHPNIVTAYDAGEHLGTHYLVMEFVDGLDLSAVLKQRGSVGVEQAINVAVQAARGLAYAHAHGVVHRDIKPGNLLVDREGTVKILDMGLARVAAESEQPEEKSLTAAGGFMGTVEYMAPEQAADAKAADHRADIYALGCTLYRLLTGKLPFPGSTPMQIVIAHRESPIPNLADSIKAPRGLQQIFAGMVGKNPDERYGSMQQVEQDLLAVTPGAATSPLAVCATGEHDLLSVPGSSTVRRLGGGSSVRSIPVARPAPRRWWTSTPALIVGAIALAFIAGLIVAGGRGVNAPPASPQSPSTSTLPDIAPAITPPPTVEATAAATAAQAVLASFESQQAEPGWYVLFDGERLDQWRLLRHKSLHGTVRVEERAMLIENGAAYLVSAQPYANFELELEWKVSPGGDGGILYFVDPVDLQPHLHSPELQLADDSAADGPRSRTGGLFNVIPPSGHFARPAGEWNTARLVVNGSQVDHFINDQLAVSFDRAASAFRKLASSTEFTPSVFAPLPEGHLALQGQSGQVWYRNVRIRPLAASEPPRRSGTLSTPPPRPDPRDRSMRTLYPPARPPEPLKAGTRDVLAMLDLQRDVTGGAPPQRTDEGLRLDHRPPAPPARVVLPLAPVGSYELRVELTKRHGGGFLGLRLSSASTIAALALNNIPELGPPKKRRPDDIPPLRDGQRHTILAKVTAGAEETKIDATLDGMPLKVRLGEGASGDRLLGDTALGILLADMDVTIHRLELTVLPPERPWTNLLAGLDAKTAGIRGAWVMRGDDLHNDGGTLGAQAVFASTLPDEYEIEVEFTRGQGADAVAFVLPVGSTGTALLLGGYNNKRSGLSDIDSRNAAGNETSRPLVMEPGRRYRLHVEVTRSGEDRRIVAKLDDSVIVEWSGPERVLSVAKNWSQSEAIRLAVGGNRTEVTLHALRLRPVAATAQR